MKVKRQNQPSHYFMSTLTECFIIKNSVDNPVGYGKLILQMIGEKIIVTHIKARVYDNLDRYSASKPLSPRSTENRFRDSLLLHSRLL